MSYCLMFCVVIFSLLLGWQLMSIGTAHIRKELERFTVSMGYSRVGMLWEVGGVIQIAAHCVATPTVWVAVSIWWHGFHQTLIALALLFIIFSDTRCTISDECPVALFFWLNSDVLRWAQASWREAVRGTTAPTHTRYYQQGAIRQRVGIHGGAGIAVFLSPAAVWMPAWDWDLRPWQP